MAVTSSVDIHSRMASFIVVCVVVDDDDEVLVAPGVGMGWEPTDVGVDTGTCEGLTNDDIRHGKAIEKVWLHEEVGSKSSARSL